MTNPAPCGTTAAYQRHRRYGEPIDDACRQAQTDAARAWRDNNRAALGRRRRANDRALRLLAELHPQEFIELLAVELVAEAERTTDAAH